MSVEVLVNTDDITVLGPPPVVNVQLDIGATGVRGSKVFVGTGSPNSLTSNIPIADIVQNTGTPLTEENFSIKFSIGHSDPTAGSITGVSITGSSNDTLSISLKAAEFSSGTWSALSETVTVHLLITIILDPTEES